MHFSAEGFKAFFSNSYRAGTSSNQSRPILNSMFPPISELQELNDFSLRKLRRNARASANLNETIELSLLLLSLDPEAAQTTSSVFKDDLRQMGKEGLLLDAIRSQVSQTGRVPRNFSAAYMYESQPSEALLNYMVQLANAADDRSRCSVAIMLVTWKATGDLSRRSLKEALSLHATVNPEYLTETQLSGWKHIGETIPDLIERASIQSP
jgi:hypothetical protein